MPRCTNASRQTQTSLPALSEQASMGLYRSDLMEQAGTGSATSAKLAKLKISALAITGLLVLGGCSGIRPEAKAAWFLRAQPRAVEQYCVSAGTVSLSASDCNVLQSFAEAQVQPLEAGKVFCLSVSDLRRNRQIWNQLSDKGKKALREHSWVSLGRRSSGGSSASGGTEAWSPGDCSFD